MEKLKERCDPMKHVNVFLRYCIYILITSEYELMRRQHAMPAAAVSKSGEFGARECEPIGCGIPVVGKLNLVVVVNCNGECSLVTCHC